MTHPLTPREKVAEIIYRLVGSDHRGDLYGVDEAASEITALASGSGDHAGLRRLADEAADFGVPAQVDPAVLNALLAEIVALRAERDALISVDEAGEPLRQATRDRATEAERKLAEAEEWRDIETAPRDGTVILGWSSFFPKRRPVEVAWDADRYALRPVPRWVARDSAYSRRAFFDHPLTHWLPLPPAPGAEA